MARSAETAARLGEAFAGREIEKYYLALSDSKPGKKQGKVAGDMAKGRGGAWRLLASQQNPAVTQFSVIRCSRACVCSCCGRAAKRISLEWH